MAGKRIPDLDPLSGAASANDDKLVIYDASTTSTKRIDRSQLAAGIVGDLPYTPSGSISATTVPTAIAELDSEVATKPAVLADIVALRAVTWPAGRPSIANLVNNYTAGDGGGLYRWDSGSTATDNGYNIIKETATTTGRWIKDATTTTVLASGASFNVPVGLPPYVVGSLTTTQVYRLPPINSVPDGYTVTIQVFDLSTGYLACYVDCQDGALIRPSQYGNAGVTRHILIGGGQVNQYIKFGSIWRGCVINGGNQESILYRAYKQPAQGGTTRAGTDAWELFDDVSNYPNTASRAPFGLGAANGLTPNKADVLLPCAGLWFLSAKMECGYNTASGEVYVALSNSPVAIGGFLSSRDRATPTMTAFSRDVQHTFCAGAGTRVSMHFYVASTINFAEPPSYGELRLLCPL